MKTLSKVQIAKIAIVLWYLVGIAGFTIRPLQPLFQKLTPFGMLMAATLLMFFHEPKDKRSGLIFLGIILFGFVIELIGVNTQAIFGFYIYGNSLGPKLWNTPIIIGLNWLVLIYCISALAKTNPRHLVFSVDWRRNNGCLRLADGACCHCQRHVVLGRWNYSVQKLHRLVSGFRIPVSDDPHPES